MTYTDTTIQNSLLENIISDEEMDKIIRDTTDQPDVSWYSFKFCTPELNEEFPNLGYMVIKQETTLSKKFNNKLIHSYECYGEFTEDTYLNCDLYFEATYPYNLIRSTYCIKTKKKITESADVYYNNHELVSNIFKNKNKTTINQGNIIYTLKNHLASDFWSNSFKRKISDNKKFFKLDIETGLLTEEIHEVIDFEDNKRDRLTKTRVHSIDIDNGEPLEEEFLTNSKYELLEFYEKNYLIAGKLTSKEKIFSKNIN
ncbi:hypothetical protein OAJ21_02025 [Pelagibacteraceae bacterium]|nr:hypothetical protein [Pelagibacteraceae bacterium]